MIKIGRISLTVFLLMCSLNAMAQQKDGVEVDYNNPKKYIVGGVKVEGTNYFSPDQIIQITGLQKGMEVTVPSENLTSIVNRLWLQRVFEDVSIAVDSLSASRDRRSSPSVLSRDRGFRAGLFPGSSQESRKT